MSSLSRSDDSGNGRVLGLGRISRHAGARLLSHEQRQRVHGAGTRGPKQAFIASLRRSRSAALRAAGGPVIRLSASAMLRCWTHSTRACASRRQSCIRSAMRLTSLGESTSVFELRIPRPIEVSAQRQNSEAEVEPSALSQFVKAYREERARLAATNVQ
jgi:hypothetical protein